MTLRNTRYTPQLCIGFSNLFSVNTPEECSKDKGKLAKKLLGAIAGAIFDEPVKQTALKASFFVIGQSGDTIKIEIPKDSNSASGNTLNSPG